MKHEKEYYLYHLLLIFFSPILLLWLLREAWQQKSKTWLTARLGKTKSIKADIWLHCASVGEVNAAAPLVQALHDRDKHLLITTFTPTGQQQAHRCFASLNRVQVRMLPFDWTWTMKRFLSRVDCPQLWLVETEFWPTLITEAKQHNMTIKLVNARITHKTLNAPLWWRRLLVQLLDHSVSHILCRNEQDCADFRQLGVIGTHLSVAGNLKWCGTLPDSLARLCNQPYIVFASTHRPEEIELAKHWQTHSELPKLVIVPRHPKRGDGIAHAFMQAQIAYSQRSHDPNKADGIILSDTFGELQSWMAHAELVIMGGSFAPKGGQNPLEAIRLGKFVLCGPDMRDFSQEINALKPHGALVQVASMDALLIQILALLAQPERISQQANAGQQWLANNQGQILENYLQLSEQPYGLS